MLVYGDMVYWARFGSHAEKIIFVKRPLAQYRWHQTNMSVYVAPNLKSLVVDCWSTMQMAEALRNKPTEPVRKMKLKGLMAVRCGIMALRFRQLGNLPYALENVKTGRGYTGWPIWLAGQFLVQLRELIVFKSPAARAIARTSLVDFPNISQIKLGSSTFLVGRRGCG